MIGGQNITEITNNNFNDKINQSDKLVSIFFLALNVHTVEKYFRFTKKWLKEWMMLYLVRLMY